MTPTLKTLTFLLPALFMILLPLAAVDASQEEHCISAHHNGEPMPKYCMDLFE
jgi:hypothetical protein